MMPTSSGDGYSAPGRAVQQLGSAIGSLGASFQAETNKQDEFNANLTLLNWENKQSADQMAAHANFTRENPDGWALEQHGSRTQSFNSDVLAKMPNQKMQQKAQLYFAQRGHNFYEQDQRFEYGKRNDMIYGNTSAAISGEFAKQAMNNPDTIVKDVSGSLAGVQAIIKSAPISEERKRSLESEAAQLAWKKIEEVYTSSGREDKLEEAARGLLMGQGIAAPTPGPQSQAPAVQTRTSGFQPKTVIFHDYGGTPKNSDGMHNPYNALVFPDGTVRYRNPSDPYGVKAPHAYKMNNSSVGIAYAGPVGSKPTPEALATLQKEYDTVRQMFPGVSHLGHGEAYQKTKGTAEQASKDGRDLTEASWRAQIQTASGSAPANPSQGLAPKLTAYAPQGGGALKGMEGGYAASKPGPDGKAEVRTLEDVASGRSQYVTIAGDPSQYGKSYTIPRIEWIDSKGNKQVSENVKAVVHDTGSAFKGKGDSRFDIPVARDLSNEQMNAQPFLKGGVQFIPEGGPGQKQQTAQFHFDSNRLYSPDEIKKFPKGSVIGWHGESFAVGSPEGKKALSEAKSAGQRVHLYFDGNGDDFGGRFPEDKKRAEDAASKMGISLDAYRKGGWITRHREMLKEASAAGVDSVEWDNINDQKDVAGFLADHSKWAKDNGIKTQLALKNLTAKQWGEVDKGISEGRIDPSVIAPYAISEESMSKAEKAAAAKIASKHGVSVGDTANTDEYATGPNGIAFTPREMNAIPGERRPMGQNQVADASGRIAPVQAGPQSQMTEQIVRMLPALAKRSEAARMKWAESIGGQLKLAMDLAEKGYGKDTDLDLIEKKIAEKPDVAAQFGLVDGLASARAFNEEARSLRLMVPQELQSVISSVERAITATDAEPAVRAAALKRKESMTKLLGEMRKGVNEDLMSWADKTGIQRVEPIDWQNPESLTKRADQARTVARYFGQQPQFFTAAERDALKDTFKLGGKNMLGMLGAMHQAFGTDTIHAMKEISNDAPIAATAGWMLSSGGHGMQIIEDVAEGLERRSKRDLGEKAPKQGVKPADIDRLFKEATQGAFQRLDKGPVIETALAAYEGRYHRLGWDKEEPEQFKAIIREVVGERKDRQGNVYGGVQNVGGWRDHSLTGPSLTSTTVILPSNVRNDISFRSPGDKSGGSTFRKLIDALRESDLVIEQGGPGTGPRPSDQNGKPLSMATIRKATPSTIGDGRYMLATGDVASGDPKWVTDGSGKPYVLDLKALEPALKARRPDLYFGYDPIAEQESTAPVSPFVPDMAHAESLARGIANAAPKGYTPGPTESDNVVDDRASTVIPSGRRDPRAAPNRIPMPRAEDAPDQVRNLLPR